MKVLALILLLPFALFAGKQEQMLTDLDVIKNAFDVLYAPADWKKKYANWDLEEKIDLAKKRVISHSSITVDEYQAIVRDFLSTTHDYHVQVLFCSDEMAGLPFRIQGAEGKYFIAWVSDSQQKGMDHVVPFQVGDEVLSFDGLPVADAVQKLKLAHFGERNSKTDESIAEGLLTKRVRMTGCFEIPQGPVSLTVRHRATNKVKSYTCEWIYKPEVIQNHFEGVSQNKKKDNILLHRDMTAPFYSAMKKADRRLFSQNDGEEEFGEEKDIGWIGSKKGFLPPLGQVIWVASEQDLFRAYIFIGPKNRPIGFIRIPEFAGGEESAETFASIIEEMQKSTDALVIDQTNNPGGSLFYMLALLSMLSDQPMVLPTQQETITQKHIYEATLAIKDIQAKRQRSHPESELAPEEARLEGYHLGGNFDENLSRYFEFLINEWNGGRTITQNAPIMGIEKILPHPKHRYTKPILFLVNHLDFSCADFMPAVLQDNGRATIMGTRTAGAGGYVIKESHPNLFGIGMFSYTGSIAERPNRQPIENLGVTPDIPCTVTARDLREGYPDYIQSVRKTLDKILK